MFEAEALLLLNALFIGAVVDSEELVRRNSVVTLALEEMLVSVGTENDDSVSDGIVESSVPEIGLLVDAVGPTVVSVELENGNGAGD
ncbi:hypothetical protein F5Y19DRAFT_444279 [Xylariaceae sp. FL1651]|nr:hypothetical protein F5Y19DRAFT_444279 [Xylariaceae sp. FL1651]